MGANQRSQITMDDGEVAAFITQSRIATMGTIGPDGRPHLVAMWYAVIDGAIWFESKGRAQKIKNLERDNRITCMIEDGNTYDTLRGVSIEGRGVIVTDPAEIWKVGIDVWERYTGPYTEDVRAFVEVMLNKRVAVRVDVERVRTWDHKKLGMPSQPVGGSTAQYLGVQR